VVKLEGAVAGDDGGVDGGEAQRVQVQTTKSFIVFPHSRVAPLVLSSPRYEDHVLQAQAGPATPGSPSSSASSTSSGSHSIANSRVLYAAIALLLSDTVLIVLTGYHAAPSKVVALDSSCDASVILEAALLTGNIWVITAILGNLNLPLVVSGAPHKEGKCS